MALFETSRPLVPVTKTGGLQAPRPLVPVTKTSTLAPPGGYGTTTTVFPPTVGAPPAGKPGGTGPGQPPAPNLSLPGGTAPGLPTGDPSYLDSNYYLAMRERTNATNSQLGNIARQGEFAQQGYDLSNSELNRAEPRDVLAQTEAGNNHGLLYAGHLVQQIADTHQNFADRHSALSLQLQSGNAARAAMQSALSQGLSDFQAIQAGAAVDRAITLAMQDISLGIDPATDSRIQGAPGLPQLPGSSVAKTTAAASRPLVAVSKRVPLQTAVNRPLVPVAKRTTLARGY